ncbi:MAG: DUF2029 domain-containing protein [Candidatus Thorarchaeota archaeon]|nr:DUF2029 domain-containing protein [Candidatus Thorarchaeota archaeon]
MAGIDISRISKVLSNHVNIVIMLLAAVNIFIAFILSIFGTQMYPFFIIVYIWIAFYIFLIAMLIRRERITEKPLIRNKMHLVGLGVLTIIIRLIFIGMTHYISLDALWYADFGTFMHMGVIPYTGFYFPYPPVFAYFIYIITSIFQGAIGFRLFAIAMDIAVLVSIWKLVHREVGPKWASTAAMAYAFLPISVIESGWNGHFEPLVSFLLLISLWALLNQKNIISGIFLGLSIATKIYPIVIFPILFVYIKGWKNRLWFTLSVGLSGALTFVPILLLSWTTNSGGTGGTTISGSTLGFVESLFGFLFTISLFSAIVTAGFAIILIFCVIRLMRLISRNDSAVNQKIYKIVTVALGVIIVIMGIVSAVFPLLPMASEVFWRFPMDIGLVRGILTIGIGLLIVFNAHREWKIGMHKHVSLKSLLTLVGATALLFIAMARQFFYGWYLLWSIPFFLLFRDKRLSYTVILCLLLVFPNYTHDNFASLGFEETRHWEDEFVTVDGWSSEIDIKGDFVNASQVSAHVDSDGTNGRFWFDTRNVTDDAYLQNVSISYTKVVEIDFDKSMEFVARIDSSWDPPFGRYADLSLSFEGNDANSEHINGTIIPITSVFTNLSYILWRFAFTNIDSPTHNGTLTLLNLTIYPVQRVESSYQIDFFYTTNAGFLNPVYFIMIPSLIAIALIAFTILYNELEIERKLASTPIIKQQNIKTESD